MQTMKKASLWSACGLISLSLITLQLINSEVAFAAKKRIGQGVFKFANEEDIFYSNGRGHYCRYRNWEEFSRLRKGDTSFTTLPGTIGDYDMTYDGICTGR